MDYERIDLVQPRYGSVNAYRVGDTLVDTGHVCAESRERLRAALDGSLAEIDRVVLTHPHMDHVGGSLAVDQVTALPHVCYEGAAEIIRTFPDYVAEVREESAAFSSGMFDGDLEYDDRYFPLDVEYATDEIDFERVVSDGDTVAVGPYDCEVVHTPGHSQQHMALFHEPSGVMLSGDIVSRNGHFMYGPVHWDIGAYKTGLQRIRERDPDLLLPGHGDPMEDPAERVADALAKAERAEQAILDAVEQQGALASHELAVEALGATPETTPFLANVASVYAIYLAEQGKLSVERRPYVVASPR
jgi:glyoxylase-like metal-dependent hydrolase (beta-lactamase superfamily II)